MNDWVAAMLFAGWGMAVGALYFALVRRTARQWAAGKVRAGGVLGAVGLRMLLFAPGVVVSAVVSLVAVGGYMVGFVAARVVMVHRRGVRNAP